MLWNIPDYFSARQTNCMSPRKRRKQTEIENKIRFSFNIKNHERKETKKLRAREKEKVFKISWNNKIWTNLWTMLNKNTE